MRQGGNLDTYFSMKETSLKRLHTIWFQPNDIFEKAKHIWPPDAKNWLIWKDPDAEKDWRWEEKGMTNDEMAGWHHRLNGHEFESTPGVGDRQGSLACCSPLGHNELDTEMTEWLNWTELKVWELPWWLSHKESDCQCRRCEFSYWVKKIPWWRKWNQLQYSCLENPMKRGERQATIHEVTESRTWHSK